MGGHMAHPNSGRFRLKMSRFSLRTRVFGAVFLAFGVLSAGMYIWDAARPQSNAPDEGLVFGATYSKEYAQSLGLDWKKAYTAVLDDLGIRLLRIPAYWDEIEPRPGQYDFSDVDWQLAEAGWRGARLNTGSTARLCWAATHSGRGVGE